MEILLDVTQSAKGRLSGTAGLAVSNDRLLFSGTIELVACVEKLCRANPAVIPSAPEGRAPGKHIAP